MEAQPLPLDPESQFFLTSELDAGRIDKATLLLLYLYADRSTVSRITRSDGTRRCKVGDALLVAECLVPFVPPRILYGLSVEAVYSLIKTTRSLAECLADWARIDEVDGGAMELFRRRSRRTRGGRGEPTAKVARRLASSEFIRRRVRAAPQARDLRRVAGLVGDFCRQHGRVDLDDEEGLGVLDWVNATLNEQRRRATEARMRAAGGSPRLARRRTRRVLRRSAALAGAVLGAEGLRTLLRGEEVRVAGPTLSLGIELSGSPAVVGHGALNLRILDRSGEPLGDLCTFVEGTPALDQVAALALLVRGGGEMELLEKGNVSRLTMAGRHHPALVARTDADAERFRERCDRERKEAAEYWGRTGEEWVRALAVYTCGQAMSDIVVRHALKMNPA